MTKQVRKINFLNEKEISIQEGQTILSASLEAGIPHYHACGGNARCSTCRILIIEGGEHLSERNEKENVLVKKFHLPLEVRLACQTSVKGGPVSVRRIIRDQSDVGLYPEQDEQIGKEQELVLMFLDIRNFTPFAADNLPFDVIHILKKMFLIFQLNIDKHGGKIIDTAGDGLYAVFGMNETMDKAATAAVAASEKIIREVKEFNEKYLAVHFFCSLEIGIGLHAGPVITGNLTVNDSDHLTVMGYAVNVASRIQNATRELNNNFLVSEKVAELLPGSSSNIPSQFIHLKGVKDDLKVYRLGNPFNEAEKMS